MTQIFNLDLEEWELPTYKPGRKCQRCKKPLSIYNAGPMCFCCAPFIITTEDGRKKKKRWPKNNTQTYDGSVCSSRETPGFDRVQREYQGCDYTEEI